MLNDAAFMDYVFHGKVALDAGPEENFTKVGIMLQNYAWMLDEADLGGTLDQQKALQNDFCNFVIRAPVKSLIGYRFDVKTWGQNIQEHLKACGIRMP